MDGVLEYQLPSKCMQRLLVRSAEVYQLCENLNMVWLYALLFFMLVVWCAEIVIDWCIRKRLQKIESYAIGSGVYS